MGQESLQSMSLDSTMLAVTPDAELVLELEHLACKWDMALIMGQRDTPDVVAIPFTVGVIDRAWLGEHYWNAFWRHLEQTAREGNPSLIVVVDRKVFQVAPVSQVMGTGPILVVGPGNVSQIVKAIEEWLAKE